MSGSRGYDPSKLHLKRELTQIQKASRGLRDPGTSSSWKSPLSTARSTFINGVALNENPTLPAPYLHDEPPTGKRERRRKRVFLYNWKNTINDFDESSVPGSVASASVDNSLNDIRNAAHVDEFIHDLGHGHGNVSKESRCKAEPRRKSLQVLGYDKNSLNLELALKNAAFSTSSIGLSQDDSASLIDRFGDTEEYYNTEDLDSLTAESPLLSRLRQKKLMKSISKFYRDSQRGDSSCTLSTPALSMSSFKRYLNGKVPKNAGSWDGSMISFNDLQDEEDHLDFPGQQGCGIPCCWSKRSTPKVKPGYGRLNRRGSSLGTGISDDELSTNFKELDLESLSRLDGRRWSSSCRSREGEEEMVILENIRSLSQRHRPMFFNELVGQSIVVQSLMNAITRGKISPVYLFQGPRGTGKTSTAKIFAAALNCLNIEETKPCGTCRECNDFISCKNKDIIEVDGTDKKGMDRVQYLLKGLAVSPATANSRYKVFVIEECHLLPSKTWVGLLKFLEEPISRVIFIFITTDAENVPRTVQSRCQRFLFNKIKDGDILRKLQRISAEERLDVESDAIQLIALNADGSLRDAETMLEQLTLLGKRITTSLVNELVGVVSDEKLLELLELAISSNTSETVKRARELLDSGADPLVLMSQLAGLIMDIIAGNHLLDGAKCVGGRTLTEVELQKLRHALKLLSEAEKQLRVSSERSTWFTATLLQLGSTSPEFTLSGSSRRQSSKTTDEDQSIASRDGPAHVQKADASMLLIDSIKAKQTQSTVDDNMILSQSDMNKLNDLWRQCIASCHHNKLRQLLQTSGKLVSLSEADGLFIAYIAFGDKKTKARAERYLISITNSFEAVLRHNVEVKIILLPDSLIPTVTRQSVMLPIKREEKMASLCNSPLIDKRSPEIPMQRIESIIREQRLETAWLQAVEKGTPRSMTRVVPKDGAVHVQRKMDLVSMDSSSHHWEDELNHEIEVLKVNNKKAVEIEVDRCPITPSFLHQSSKEYQGHESGTGGGICNILFCWNNKRPRRAKTIRKTPTRSHKGGRFLCFRECIGSKNGLSKDS